MIGEMVGRGDGVPADPRGLTGGGRAASSGAGASRAGLRHRADQPLGREKEQTMPDGSNVAALILDDREDGIFRVHRSVFVDREIFERERALVFDKSWLFAGHVSEFPNPGDFVTRSVAGRPV